MQKVERGNAIFMYAKRVGIIGIGQARASHKVLQPSDHGRLWKGGPPEWRVRVDWLAWKEHDADCFLWPSAYATFFDVSGEKYRSLRDDVRRHFSGRS